LLTASRLPARQHACDRREEVAPMKAGRDGLFELVLRCAGETRSWDIDWKPERLVTAKSSSATLHFCGRPIQK
jgi:hypothetical protein